MSKNLSKLQEKGKDYGADAKVLEKLDAIKGEWDNQSKNQKIQQAGKVVETAINALDDLQSNNPVDVIKGSLDIVGSIVALVGGPYGAAAGAVCGVLGAILSANTPKKPNMATVFADKVRAELARVKQDDRLDRFEGLKANMKAMFGNLNVLKTSMPGEAENHNPLPNPALWQRDFGNFIGEISRDFTKDVSCNDKESLNACVNAMVMYCNAQTSFMLLLGSIIATFKATGHNISYVQEQLKLQKDDAKEKLGFLSDKKYLAPGGLLPLEGGAGGNGGKMLKIFKLRSNIKSFVIVNEFIKKNKMKEMPTNAFVEQKVDEATKFKLEMIWDTKLYPHPEKKPNNHYFQLINHTSLPINVFCGTAGDDINGLKFEREIQSFSSYEHRASTKSSNFFSAGGYFVMYFDKVGSSDFRVFEFALENPRMGFRKLAFMEKTNTASLRKNELVKVSGQDCWDKMTADIPPRLYFAHGKKHFVLEGHYTESPHFFPVVEVSVKDVDNNPLVDLTNKAFRFISKAVAYHPYVQLLPKEWGPAEGYTDSNFSRTWTFLVQEIESHLIPPK